MSEIKRFDVGTDYDCGVMIECSNGDYVEWNDYAALKSELDRVQAALLQNNATTPAPINLPALLLPEDTPDLINLTLEQQTEFNSGFWYGVEKVKRLNQHREVNLAALVPDVLTVTEASKHTAGLSFAETVAFSDGVNWMRAEILRRIEQSKLDEKRRAFIGSVTDTTPQQFESLVSGGDKKKT